MLTFAVWLASKIGERLGMWGPMFPMDPHNNPMPFLLVSSDVVIFALAGFIGWERWQERLRAGKS